MKHVTLAKENLLVIPYSKFLISMIMHFGQVSKNCNEMPDLRQFNMALLNHMKQIMMLKKISRNGAIRCFEFALKSSGHAQFKFLVSMVTHVWP